MDDKATTIATKMFLKKEEEELFTRSAQCSFSNLKKELKEIETFLNKIKQIISCEEEKKQAQSLSNGNWKKPHNQPITLTINARRRIE